MKRYCEGLLIFASLFFLVTTNLFAQEILPPGIDSVVIIFENPPVETVQKAPLKYNKAFAMSFQMDDALSDIFKKVYPVFEGAGNTQGLTYTDGCGNSVNFKMSSAVFIFSSYNNSDILNPDDPYHDKSKLTWPELDTLFRKHWGIENHGLFDNPDLSSPEKIEYAFQRTKSYARRKISDSITFKSFVIPNGDDTYVSYLSRNHYHSAINQGNDNTWIGFHGLGFDVSSDTIDWLKPTKLNRLFMYSGFKDIADSLYHESKRGIHKWFLSGMHTLPGNFLSDMEEIYNTYGKPGLDDILLAPDDEILDYLAVKQATKLHQTKKGNRLTITFSGNIPTDRMYYALSLNVYAHQLIDSIQVYGAKKYSFNGIGKDTALINLSWDGRYYYPTEMLADSFTNLAMTTGSEWKALVAMDYVEKLASGKNKIRLQDSLCSLDQSGWAVKYDAGFCNLVHLGPDTTLCPGDSLTLRGPDNMAAYNWYKNGKTFSTSPSVTVFPDSTTAYALKVNDKSGNEMGDTLKVTVFSVPKIALGADTNLCAGSCLTFSGPQGDYVYRWSGGDTTSSVTVCPVSDTMISLTVLTTDGCKISDSIQIRHDLPPEISIPQDSSSHCFGDSVLLAVSGADPGLSYQWNNGDTTFSVVFLPATADTTYRFSVLATSSAGCITEDTAHVFVLPEIPAFHIGADTGLCAGSCLTFSGPQGDYVYRWSGGDTTSSVTVCPVSDTMISLTVFTPQSCSASDSVKIIYHLQPEISIPQDSSSHCFGDSVLLTVSGADPGLSYQWNNGDTTSSVAFLPATADTTYRFSVLATSSAGCITKDTAHVFVYPLLSVFTDYDTLETCENLSTVVSCTPVQGSFNSFIWSYNGDTITTKVNRFTVENPVSSEWIQLTAVDKTGCSAHDSTFLFTANYPEIILPNDTSVCRGDSLHLSATGGKLFYWVEGTDTLSDNSQLAVRPLQSTTYRAVSGNDELCMVSDRFTVSVNPLPETKIVRNSSPVCVNTPLTLTASGADHYFWLPGNVESDTFSIKPQDTLTVFLTGISAEGCVAKDSLSLAPAPLPLTRFSGLMPSYCENDPVVTLQGDPEGGLFSGNGMDGNGFSPAVAGPGNHTIYYTYVSPAGCVGKSGKDVFVYGPVPAIHLSPKDDTLQPDGFVRYDAGHGFEYYYWTTGDMTQKIRVDYNQFPVGTDTIRVVGVTGGCSSVGSAVITFANPTGIPNLHIEPLGIYPNPSHAGVTLSFRGNGKPLLLEIFDMAGNRIFVRQQAGCLGNCHIKINITSLKPGSYYVWLYNEIKSFFSKLIVQ